MRSLQRVAGLPPQVRPNSFCCALVIACLAWCGDPQPAWASQATQTTLSVTSGGNAVSSVAGGTVVTLTATVQAAGAALTLGQVNFCDATAASCTDIHLVGTAQLTSAGTAVLRFRPGSGSPSYKAIFLGALEGAASASAAVRLSVGPRPAGPQTTYTNASISGPLTSQTADTYALTANVGTKGTTPPSGTVSFSGVSSSAGGASFPAGTATLGPLSGGSGFMIVPIPEPFGEDDAIPLTAVADFNGDGIPDIIFSPNGAIEVSLGNGDGTFASPVLAPVDQEDGINAFAVGDFNGDGNTDILVADEDTGQLTVLLGKGDGTFTVGQSMPCGTHSIAVADFNGDGKLDVALSGNTMTTILLGNGDGTFTAAPNPPQIGSLQLVAADFNGDGQIDLALVSYSTSTFAFTPITILLSNGDGTFTVAPSQPQLVASQLVAADLNGDGKIDLAALDSVGDTLSILLSNGDGTFNAAPSFPTDSPAFSLVVGDFNGDDKPDLAIAGAGNYPDHEVTFFTGNGDGTFATGLVVADASAEPLAVADLTGSGSSDVVTLRSVILGNLALSTATVDYVLPDGNDAIQANYAGDANNAPSSSTNAPVVSVPLPAFSLASSPTMVAPGATASGDFSVTSTSFTGNLNLSCSISSVQSQASSPACSVQSTVNFYSPGGSLGLLYSVTTQPTTPIGQYSITITASNTAGIAPVSTATTVLVGAQNYQLSNNGATNVSVGAIGNSTITITPTGGYTGQVTMSCAVSTGQFPGAIPPTCTIPSPIAVAGLPVTTTLTLNTQPATSPGNYAVTVTGASAGSLNTTTGFTFTVPAVTAVPPGFALSGTAVTIASPGPSATSTITITPGGGFSGTLALSCAVTGGPMGGVDAPTCSVTAPPAIAGTAAVTAMLTVSTTAASTAANSYPAIRNQLPSRDVAMGSSAVALASLLWFGFPVRRRNKLSLLGLLLVSILLGATMGCGGTSANAPAPPANPAPLANPGTTPGEYTVTVTGSSGAIIAATAVTVTVN
jgi:trimeric autotransporter adhesin